MSLDDFRLLVVVVVALNMCAWLAQITDILLVAQLHAMELPQVIV